MEKKKFSEPHSFTSPLFQLNKNSLASTLNCYLGNPDKSHILKYPKISGHFVSSQKPKQIKIKNPHIQKSQWTWSTRNMKKTIWSSSQSFAQNQRPRENLKSSQGKKDVSFFTYRGTSWKEKNTFLDGNNANKNTKEQHLYNTERKSCQPTILYPAKMFGKYSWNKDFFRQMKAERIPH